MAHGRRGPRAALLACVLAGLLALLGQAAAQSVQSQASALEKIRGQLNPSGWQYVDPNADPCASPGTLTPGVVCSGNAVTEM